MAPPRPIRTWSSTPFAQGPRSPGSPRRVALGSQPAAAPTRASAQPIPHPTAQIVSRSAPTAVAAAPVAEAKISCIQGGPYLAFGVSVQCPDGTVRTATDGKPLALCACGRSTTKPFCNGAHREAAPLLEPPPAV